MAKAPTPFAYRGGWRAQITLPNKSRPFKDFDSHSDAQQWLTDQAANAKATHQAVLGGPKQATLAQALDYYARFYSVHKGGIDAELSRINRYLAAAGMPELKAEKNETGGVKVVAKELKTACPGLHSLVSRRRASRSETNAARDALAVKTCSSLSRVNMNEFRALMKNEGLSESTVQKEFAMLKTMFKEAGENWEWGTFKSPCEKMKLGKSARRFVKLDDAQRAALDKALTECENPYFWPLVVVAKESTLRRKTLLDMRWDDIDLDDRAAVLSTKTGQCLHKFSKPVLEVLADVPRHPSGRVFPLSASAVTQAWNRVRERAGLPTLQYRDLRHLGATDWARRGLAAHSLQNVLGHRSITTAQYYVDLVAKDIEIALDKAMESGCAMAPPPPGLADAAAQHSLNRTNRLQAAVQAKRAAKAGLTDSTTAVAAPAATATQDGGYAAEASTENDATAVFLALHTSLTREKPSDRLEPVPSNVVAFRVRKAA
jgi:integrase